MESARKVPDEIRQILAEVCAEYRVRIDPDDPAVAIVMLNRRVLELALNRAVERIEASTTAFNETISAVQFRMGAVLAQELVAVVKRAGTTASASTKVDAPSRRLALFASALLIFSVGLIFGILIR